jgi:hypothetical protein
VEQGLTVRFANVYILSQSRKLRAVAEEVERKTIQIIEEAK